MNDLVKFPIPAAFVIDRVLPTAAELVYGFKHGWLDAEDVVRVALAALEAGIPLSQPEEELALLLSRELDHVPSLIDELERVSDQEDNPAAVWLFLILAWIYEHRTEFYDPLGMIEMLYADFDYPREIMSLVGFMPASSGASTGHAAIEENWRDYVTRKTAEYRNRRAL